MPPAIPKSCLKPKGRLKPNSGFPRRPETFVIPQNPTKTFRGFWGILQRSLCKNKSIRSHNWCAIHHFTETNYAHTKSYYRLWHGQNAGGGFGETRATGRAGGNSRRRCTAALASTSAVFPAKLIVESEQRGHNADKVAVFAAAMNAKNTLIPKLRGRQFRQTDNLDGVTVLNARPEFLMIASVKLTDPD